MSEAEYRVDRMIDRSISVGSGKDYSHRPDPIHAFDYFSDDAVRDAVKNKLKITAPSEGYEKIINELSVSSYNLSSKQRSVLHKFLLWG